MTKSQAIDVGTGIDIDAVAAVEHIIRSVGRQVVLPKFGQLAKGDVSEKAPGDPVTVADRDAESALAERLTALLPGSIVVAEEAVSADRELLGRLTGPEPVWIIDPIDGTESFIRGNPRFCTLVALARHGQVLASWTHAPALGTTATARAGGGAFVDGRRVRVAHAPRPRELRHLDVAVPLPKWCAATDQAQINALAEHEVSLSYLDTSGLDYVELASGRRHVMVLNWENCWDHAAGVLLHQEAGGVCITADGSRFRLAGGNRLPFVAAPDLDCATAVHAALATALPDDTNTTTTPG
jgi:fructose-1,6-bisphosphatase/inositol monophosphatase family enzyme